MIRIRRAFTLIELLVAMGLTMVLLVVLTSLYDYVIRAGIEGEKTQTESYHLRYAENRLAYLFHRAIFTKDPKEKFFFFTTNSDAGGAILSGSPSLIFTLKNEVCLDKDFSGIVLGRLYIDSQHRLCVSMWPHPTEWLNNAEVPSMRQEILLENVEKLALSFLTPPTVQSKAILDEFDDIFSFSKTDVPRDAWISEWSQNFKKLPAMIRIEIIQIKDKTEEKSSFAFPLLKAKEPIVYQKI